MGRRPFRDPALPPRLIEPGGTTLWREHPQAEEVVDHISDLLDEEAAELGWTPQRRRSIEDARMSYWSGYSTLRDGCLRMVCHYCWEPVRLPGRAGADPAL